MALSAAAVKVIIYAGQKAISAVATEEGRKKIANIALAGIASFVVIVSVPAAIVENGVEDIKNFFGLSDEAAEKLENLKEGLKGYFPEEILEEDDIKRNENAIFPFPIAGENIKLSSGYGNRKDPFTGAVSFHSGLDIVSGSAKGANVIAVADGTVVLSLPPNLSRGYGNMIMIYHDSEEVYTLYAHLKERRVFEGDKVIQYQVIGIEGTTGRSTGRHLHFEIRKTMNKNSTLNPEDYLY